MGRKLPLTVRKCRSNERQKIKEKKALRLTGGEEAAETANLVEIVDKLFDCLNVSSMSKGRHQRKAFLQPYISQMIFELKYATIHTLLYSNLLK